MSNCMIVRRGRSKKLQTKTVAPSTSQQTVTPDSGYDGLSQVTVEAISPTKAAQTYTPGTSDQTISSGRWLTGKQTIKGDADLVAGNIKKGVNIFGVTGTLTSMSNENAILHIYVDVADATVTVSDRSGTYTETQGKSDGFNSGYDRLFVLPISDNDAHYFDVVTSSGRISTESLYAGDFKATYFT